ncbi:DUF805 domain-containing protein [Pararhodonellum marinum]|uniref:DUF805 domain-containing protein n=1 Tax=Pararhodonellum marinum TaxID=2755358 RepID=UPI00188FA009|nr:DUF805 domain-containing protein [Pararhodonellum marinum]
MKNIFDPTSRISRRKYLVYFIVFYFINLLSLMKMYESFENESWVPFVIFGIILITTIILLLIQAVKRLHDIGMDWKYVFFLLIPPPINFIGFIWLAVKEGQKGDNEYGADPLKTDVV